MNSYIAESVDQFVNKINDSTREPVYCSETSANVLVGIPDDYGFCHWEIIPRDLSDKVESIEKRLGIRFPESYRLLISRYIFPSFAFNGVLLFGNTIDNNDYFELSVRLFSDHLLSKVLVDNGYLQIGIPESGVYDPVCFAPRMTKQKERSIVQLDHEAILQNKAIKIVQYVDESFLEFISTKPKE